MVPSSSPPSRLRLLLVDSVSALAVKLNLTSLALHLPPQPLSPIRHVRSSISIPCFLAALFALTAFITASTTPQLPASRPRRHDDPRSAAAAAVFFLGRVRRYGGGSGAGLAGWGIGTGLGGVVCTVLPFVLTVRLGLLLRDAVGYVYYLATLILVAYLAVLPPSHASDLAILTVEDKPRLEDNDDDLKPLMHDLSPTSPPDALTAQTPVFTTHTSFGTAYGLATCLETLLARSSLLLLRVQRHKLVLTTTRIHAALPLLTSSSLLPPHTLFVLAPAFEVSLAGGPVYDKIFARALEQLDHVVSVGKTAGVLMGSLLGSLEEAQFCASGHRPSPRWWYTTK
ncbi:CLN3 protein [Hirsutella rhossiliensis]|uniref:CLN3 protein n=1 Tax=Hirsutella rhossiliensis TaxID=111463 RepID=A0A9P8MWQ8_9HYPO|nr:CLN3 protein [Hirsutella rhossiliensis]KAH0961799.1 CLN3 protein [Hirsutella rhossiliensis]